MIPYCRQVAIYASGNISPETPGASANAVLPVCYFAITFTPKKMQLAYTIISTPFRHPFTISGGRSKTVQRALVVCLRLGNFIGYGEAPEISYYNTTVEKMIHALERRRAFVEKFALIDPARYWHYLHHLFPEDPFLVCALDIAAWDLFGQMKGLPLYKVWKTDWIKTPVTDYTIGLGTQEEMIQKIKEKPWPVKTDSAVKAAFWPPVIKEHSPLTSEALVSVAQKIAPSCGGIKAP